jgi:hypothetical protein
VIAPGRLGGELSDLRSMDGGASVSAAKVTAMLSRWLTRLDDTARINILLKNGAFDMSLHSLASGTATIDWYEDRVSARGASVRPKRTLVAAGKLAFPTPSIATLKIKLTVEGRRLLKHAKQLRLTTKGTFAAVGTPPIVSTNTFLIKR